MNRDLNNMISIRLREKICFNFLENMNHYYDIDKKLNNIKLRRSAAEISNSALSANGLVWLGYLFWDGVFLDLRPSSLLPIRPTSTWF